MKRVLLLFLTIFITAPIFSASSSTSDTTEFRISAYKILADEPYLKMYAVSALNYNLDSIDTSTLIPLDMTDYLSVLDSKYLGAVASDIPSEVLFSFRVEGNVAGQYSVTVGMSDFRKRFSDPEHVYQDDEQVKISYKVVNSNVVFQTANTTSSKDGFVVSLNEDADENRLAWSVEDDSGNIKMTGRYSDDIWITRAGVAVVLDEQDYENCQYGLYSSDVTITLEVV